MANAIIGEDIGRSLIDLLGLPERTFEIDIHIPLREAVTVSCKYYPTPGPEEIEGVKEVFARYELDEKEEITNQEERNEKDYRGI